MKFQHFPKRSRKGNTSPFPKSVPEKGTCSHRSPAISSKEKRFQELPKKLPKTLDFSQKQVSLCNYFWEFLYPSPKNLDFMRVTAICTVSQKHHFQKPLCPDATLFILQWAKISILHTSPFPPHTTPSLSPLTVTEFGAKTAPNPVFLRFSGPDGGTESEPDPRLSTGFPTRFLFLKEDKDFCLKQDNQGYTKTKWLFKLNRPRRLTRQIIHHPVNPSDLIDNPAHNLTEHLIRNLAASAVIKSTVFTARSATA